jgi:hypothetical protein
MNSKLKRTWNETNRPAYVEVLHWHLYGQNEETFEAPSQDSPSPDRYLKRYIANTKQNYQPFCYDFR